MENNNLRNPGVPYATGGVPQEPVAQAPAPLFADVTRSAPSAPIQQTTPLVTATPVAAAPTAPAVAPLPPATPPAQTPPVNSVSSVQPPKKPRDWRKIVLTISFAALFLLFIGAGWLIFEAVRSGNNTTTPVNSELASTTIPLSEFAGSGSLNLLGTQSLAVNGQLRANESFVLSPQGQPSKSERGQLYFDAATNRLAYYNGSQFVQIADDEEDQPSVLTLQGQTGNITLVGGAGVAVNGTTLTNTGVTALAGLTGDVALGGGLSVVNGAISNTGLVGATGGTGISVVSDGSGNITISNTGSGTGTVTSPNGTPGRIAKFTGVQSIEDSLLSEAGTTITVNGNLNVTGTTTLGTALGVNSGGTGATSFTANGVIIGNGSGALTAVAAAGVGECLMSTAGAPVFQACPGGSGGVMSLNGLNGAITLANASAAGSTITINDASTSQKGIAQFNSQNFTVTGGVVNTIQNITVTATPTFGALTLTSSQATSPMLFVNNTNGAGTGNLIDLQLNGSSRMAVSPAGNMTLTGTVNGQTISSAANFTGSLAVAGAANLNGGATVAGTLTANTITPTSAMTVGATNQSLTLQGNASTTLRATNGASTTTLSFQSPTANVNYRLLTAVAGTYDICTTVGNCAGVGGGVTTSGGTTNRIPKFTGPQGLGDSSISDDGTTVSIGGVLAVNTITPTGALTIGATNQPLALQGTNTTISSTSGVITNTLSFATPTGSNKAITIPDASGTVVVSASGPLSIDSNGNITCPTCSLSGSGVTSLNGLTGGLSLAYATGSGSTVTIQDASTSQKGVAQFNSNNFSVSGGVVNTIQDIGVAAAPTFGRLTVTSNQASSTMLLINNTNAGASGNLLDVQLNGASRLSVSPAGAMTVAGTVNGQTISSSANFTGTLAVASAANLNGGATVSGTLTANTITPTSALTVGATNQSFLVQGSAASTITATSGANTTTLAFQSPTAAVTYRFLTAAAGTYDVCTTVGNCAGVGGGVTTSGGTTNRLAKFTGSSAIGDSIITDNGTTVTVGGTLAVNTLTPTAALTIGATSQNLTMQGATVNLTSTAGGITNTLTFATPSGSNKTITVPSASGTLVVSASGPLAIDATGNITCATCAIAGSGVTSLNSLTGALTIANATAAGSTVTINDASTSQKGIAQFNSTNFSTSGGVVNTIQDISVAAAPTFGRLTVTSSQASNAMLLINNTNASASGNLLDVQLNGSSRLSVSPAGAMTVAGTVNGQTISSAANFTGTLAVAGAANLNGGATVTGTLTANTITPSGALTVGATNQSFLMQGNASSTITATSGANTTTVAFQSPTANVTYRLLTAAAGTYDICTTAGNCAGVGGGVTTPGGTTNRVAKFTASGTIADSIITDNGTTVTVGGTLAVNTITPGAAMTIGATTQNLTLQGATTSLSSTSGASTNTLTFATPSGSNKTITVPNATGTVAVSASGPLSIDAAGNITCATCITSGGGSGGVGAVDSLNGLTGALTIANATATGSTITIDDASTSQKGIAQFNSSNFSASGGVVNTIQDIGVAAAPTFGRLTVTSSQASNAMFLINNTNASASGNLLDVQLNGASRLAVSPAGAMTVAGTVNGQTISSAASFTGTLAVAGSANLNGGATVTGTLTANTITPNAALTVGATNQSFLVQGSAASTITATSGANTTTLAFQSPTAAVTYRFLTAAAGTYDVCTTVGNCVGVGGGVTSAGGTTNQLAKFTGSNAIGNSIISDNGSTVTIGGTLAVNTLTPTAALTVGATSQNLTMQGATVNLTSTSGGITNTLTFATPSGSNKTITVPNASGTLVVSASGPLAIDASGNITCATCASTTGSVASLNGLTGAITLANASAAGSTVTINDASTAQKGIAQFNSTNFSASGGVINTIQNINTSAAPSFGQLTLTSSQASAAMLTVNNTNVSASGNLIDLQLNGSSRLAVSPAGNMTLVGTLNGQTISSSASFTGSLAVATNGTFGGDVAVNGGDITSTGALAITPGGALTAGSTTQSFLLQGNSSSTITATSGANTTTLSFQTPTANVTYRLLTAAAGTYDVCTTVGNCVGIGGGVTTSGGTTGTIAKFTASGAIGDSLLSESGGIVTTTGTARATTAVQAPLFDTATATALNIGTTNATAINLNQNTNVTGNLDASGTLAVGSADQFQVDASGNTSIANTKTGSTAGALATLTLTNNTTSGIQRGQLIQNAAGTGVTEALLVLDNADTDTAVTTGIQISAAAGGIQTAIDLTDSDIGTALSVADNTIAGTTANLDFTNFDVIGSTGNITTAGDLAVNGGDITSSASTLTITSADYMNFNNTVGYSFRNNNTERMYLDGQNGKLNIYATNSFGGLQVTASTGLSILSVAGDGTNVSIGYPYDSDASLFVLDTKIGAGDPSGINGAMYYNEGSGKMRCYEGGAWKDCIVGTVNGTLTANTITSTGAMTVGNAAQTLALQGTTTNINSGSTIVKATGSSTAAFQVQNSGSTPLLTVNASTNNVSVANKLTVGSFDGAGLTDCDASNAKLLWDATTSQFSCGTDRASFTVHRAADETVNNTATLQNDDYYSFNIGANETWAYQMFFEVNSNATANFRANLTAPTGASCHMAVSNLYNVTNYATSTCNDPGTIGQAATFDNEYIVYGTVTTGGTSGTVRFAWAQGTANASNTTVRAGGYMVAYKLSGADVAEAYYTRDGSVSPGDIVQVDGSLTAGVKKTTGAYSQSTLGVVSTEPGFVLGNPKDAKKSDGRPVLLALNGRVPVKVSMENGPVHAGDYLTASSTPGVAMKAIRPGQVIGTALEDFNTNAPSGMGLVNVFVNPMWATPDTSGLQVAGNGADIQGQKGTTFNESVAINGTLTVKDTLTVDPEKHRVVVGTENGDAYGTLLVLGNKTTAGDPEGTNGAMYYNAVTNKFRCFEGGAWKDCIGGTPAPTSSAAAPWSANLLASDKPLPDCLLTSTVRTLGDCATPGANNRFVTKVDLTNTTQARLVASGYDTLGGGHLRLQYSRDGTTWKYLDGGKGPDLATNASPNASAWVNVTADARDDVWMRVVVDGSGTLSSLTTVNAQFK